MAEVIPIPLLRAAARYMAMRPPTAEEITAREFQERQDALNRAVAAEEAAGIRFGPAWAELERSSAVTRATVEVTDGPGDSPHRHTQNPCPILRCHYCENRTEEDDRLCLACQELFRAFLAGKMSDEEFAEQDRYRQIVTPHPRGEHLLKDENGKTIGTKEPESGTWVFTRHGKTEEVASPTQR